MNKSYLPFIDWMKALGMLLIVWGHVASRTTSGATPPVLTKQFGVAFFLFVLGFSLTREKRTSKEVCFNRLFEIYLFGIAGALVMSVVAYFQAGRLNLSNYEPFVLGINVVIDSFPANPTTWFLGTYLHILLFWALFLRSRPIRPWMLALSIVVEITVRAALMPSAGLLVAYMALPNWLTVFVLGLHFGQKREQPPVHNRMLLASCLVGYGTVLVAWPLLANPWVRDNSFPFQRLGVGSPIIDFAMTSASVTFLYVFHTSMVYQITRWAPAQAVVRFFARNTLVVFIGHMPLYYFLTPWLQDHVSSYWGRVSILMLICWLLLAAVSEGICRLIQPKHLRDRVWGFLAGADHAMTVEAASGLGAKDCALAAKDG